jgi:hypothetical protein
MTTIRICLEPHDGVSNDTPETIRHLADARLAGFGAEYAGFISFDASESRYGRFEPMWQYIVRGGDAALFARLRAAAEELVPGYVAHVALEGASA